ncbi:MAG: hypothetical protein DRJ96_00200 [Thermoprotei archaeon]|nr:MAG: hypothetical protein DRJ67_02430 [Thermoprotei archaeon]RLE96048.1 MAG: hypothetical protein DRJ57_05990 [Thermoprotei archaeon]RLE98691.1 MAG: hypothetical protein DRJ96_00200 [Thermoprotei archaeon]
MPSKRRRSEEAGDLLSFLGVGEEKPVAREEAGERAVLSYIRGRGGRVRRSELYAWAKRRGITPAVLYKSLMKLMEEGVLRREFDESSEEVVYTLSS